MRRRHKKLLELLEESGDGLFRLLVRLTLREDIAEELMQDLFIKLNKAKGIDKAKNLRAYARRAAINLAFDWRRRQKNLVLPLGSVAEPVSQSCCPLNKIVHAEELEEVLEAVGRLKGLMRQAFVMRHIEEESYEQIAKKLGKTQHQVRGMCFRALTRVRDLVTGRSKSWEKEVCDDRI